MDEIVQMLDTLAKVRQQKDATRAQKQAEIDEVTAPIKDALAEIDTRFFDSLFAAEANITTLEAEIKQAVVARGASVKAAILHAVFSKGRVSWDTKALDGYAVAHPELKTFRTTGEPSVSIREVKQ